MTYDLQFVDQITASPTVRLNLKAEPWTVRDGTDFPPPELRRSVVSTLLADGERYPAASYGNRVLQIVLQAAATATDDEVATALQTLYRELDRPSNILRYRPGTTAPVFFRTFRAGPSDVVWNPVLKEVTVTIPAEPFALGLRETLSAVTVYNDPAEGTTLNTNPFFETDASGWTALDGAIARSTAQFHDGVASLLLTPNGVGATPRAQATAVPVSTASTYRSSAWVRCDVARNVDVGIFWFDSGGVFISTSSTTVAVAATTWTLIDGTFTPPGTAVTASLMVRLTGTPPVGHLLYIDEARLRQVGGAGGMCLDVTSPKGDVETPLFLSVAAPDVILNGRRQSVIAVRRGGSPSGMPGVLQAESMTALTDTSVQPNSTVMSGSSTNYMRTTFATDTALALRLQIGLFPATTSVDVRGTYRVFVRVRKTVGTDTMTMRISASLDGAVLNSDTVTLPSGTDIRWVDLGLFPFPFGYDPQTDGLSGTPVSVRGVLVQLAAGRSAGAGSLDVDALMFVPADDRYCEVLWPEWSGPTAFVVDAAANAVYGIGASGELRPTQPIEFEGLPPMVTPGVANRVVFMLDVGSTASPGDDRAETVQITPYYWPRYLLVRGVAS